MIAREAGQQSTPGPKPEYDAVIREAGELLKNSPVSSPHLSRLWSEVDWVKQDDQRVTGDAEMARDGSCRISIYPSLTQKSKKLAAYTILREFGRLIFKKAPENLRRQWTYKLALPSERQVEAVQAKLTPEFKTYREMVESFKTAMDRYVALNFSNALIAKGVPYAQSQNIKLKDWGATQEYANRRRYHVLIPLASAYSSTEIFEDFGAAMADWVCGTNGITESSVAEAVHDIIKGIVEGLR